MTGLSSRIHRRRPASNIPTARARVASALLIAFLACGLAAWMDACGWLVGFENITWSQRVRRLAHPSASTPKIKLILVDQASLDWMQSAQGLPWPWPRETYAGILDFCHRSGARSVAFDVLFSEDSPFGVSDDDVFGTAIRRSGNMVAAFYTGTQSGTNAPRSQVPPFPPAADLGPWLTPERERRLSDPRATLPIPAIATNALLLGSVKAEADPDGVLRRAALLRILDGRAVPTLPMAAFLAGQKPASQMNSGSRLGRMLEQIPCDRSGHFVIPRFRGRANTYECLNAAAVLQSELRLREGKPSTPDSISTNALRDCHVFVGFSAPGLKDLKVTPVDRDYCGVEWNATVLDNLLERDFLREPGRTVVFPVTLLLTSLAGVWMRFSRNARQALLLFIGFLAVPILAGFAAYPAGWWWPVAWPATAVSMSMLGTLLLNYAVEGRQKRFLRSAFRQYLSHEFIEQMLEHPEQLQLGGEKRELTMLFSDLEKFSSFSERLPPSELTALLNDYLTDMTRIIQDEGGTVDKFVGDAIVAFWNAPINQPDHAARACRAALLCQRRLAERRAEFETRAGAPFRMRVGMNTGDVTVGNLGSETRFNYTVLGDAANLASRLEGANKYFGTFTMIADSTRQQAAQAVNVRQLGALRVVGRKTPVIVYEVTGLAGEPVPEHVRAFEEGLALCREKRWKDAGQVFARFPDDPPARLYHDKCHSLVESGSDWDMVWNLTEK